MYKWIVHFVLDNSPEPVDNVHIAVTAFTTVNDEKVAVADAAIHLSNKGLWRCHLIEYIGRTEEGEFSDHCQTAGSTR